MTDIAPRVRFAPSPTGKLHIGGARTAIYNWAFARANDGAFILRIEDTDPERSTEENVQVILSAMRWLGLDWDEGPEVGGACGPYFQMQRMDTYAAALEELKGRGLAYPCFCTKEELDRKRKLAEREEGGYGGYDGTCRHISPDEANARIAAGEEHVWRLAVPEGHGPIKFHDEVYGEVEFPGDAIDDLVLVRSDGSPTYNFAVVCDDANMGITHVIRGEDHLSNTPKQILIYEALGLDVPQFAHLPMILGTDGKKLSKRHGATSVEEFRNEGYLPDAMVNCLALLGWSLDGETTIVTPEQICEHFSLDRISKKDSVFDTEKLDWICGNYIRSMSQGSWLDVATPWIAQAKADGSKVASGATVIAHEEMAEDAALEAKVPGKDVDPEHWQGYLADVNDNRDFYMRMCPLVQERMERFDEIPSKLEYLFWGPNIVLDAKSVKKVLGKQGAFQALSICRGVLADEGIEWDCDALQERCRALGEEAGIKPRNLFQPLRVAFSGNMVSPPLFESIVLLPREDVLSRIDSTVSLVFEGEELKDRYKQ